MLHTFIFPNLTNIILSFDPIVKNIFVHGRNFISLVHLKSNMFWYPKMKLNKIYYMYSAEMRDPSTAHKHAVLDWIHFLNLTLTLYNSLFLFLFLILSYQLQFHFTELSHTTLSLCEGRCIIISTTT